MNFLKILYSLFIAVVLVACASQKVNQSSNDRLYKKGNNELNSKYTVYHINDSVSQLFYELSNDVLIYKKTDTSNYFYCDVKLQLQVKLEDKLDQMVYLLSLLVKKDMNSYMDAQKVNSILKGINNH